MNTIISTYFSVVRNPRVTSLTMFLWKIPLNVFSSIDAMDTQREIVELTVDKRGHCLPALKTNQKSLYENVECTFKAHGQDKYQTHDVGHGRIETRKCSILPAREYLPDENLQGWKNLGTVIRLESAGEIRGKITKET